MLWLYIPMGILAYIFAGIFVSRLSYNHHLDKYYGQRLEKFKGSYQILDALEFHEMCLNHAKSDMKIYDADFGSIFGGMLWPIYLPILLFLKVVKAIPKFTFMQSKAERTVARMKDTKAIADKKKKEWTLALATMEEAGIDTKELRKMKIE